AGRRLARPGRRASGPAGPGPGRSRGLPHRRPPMSLRQLNLATRPFRNERLPALLLALAFTVAGAVTLKHALMVRRLMPGRTSGLARQVDDLEAERARLGSEVARLRAPRPEPAVLGRWTRLTELVDRRAFSWSRLF